MPPGGSTRAEILSGCPSLDRGCRETEVGFEPWTFQAVNSLPNHLSSPTNQELDQPALTNLSASSGRSKLRSKPDQSGLKSLNLVDRATGHVKSGSG
ncbi:hypothetical protein T265_05391 [Opisthorchis viverrini]|uniref:Uncharacterized protein n=1 Tax=Opisthorchis viverrini TaxID=6198 RepID=A0A074ZP36_OPIVI|nr:hypothetical protein T265_05391 [Opisthorchis viverrini]KER27572.1 hypothetical protein T265_05391 [Opisthorchis viverrini]